jgi:hypothetical protein
MTSWTLAVWVTATLASAGIKVGGRYESPLGEVLVSGKRGRLVATMAQDSRPCGFKKGHQVFKGHLVDDSISGTVTLCSTTKGCGSQELFVVLLVARNGELLSGAVQHKKGAACELPLRGKGITFTRLAAADVARAKGGAAHQERPEHAVQSAADEKMAEMPFSSWDPGQTARTGVVSRSSALDLGKKAGSILAAGHFEDARSVLLQALTQDPGYAEGYNMMGVTYYARDNYQQALDWYKKALTANPDFGDAWYNMACVYALENKHELAMRFLRIAVINGYREVGAMQSDDDLASLRNLPDYAALIAQASGASEAAPGGSPTSEGSTP